MTNYIKEQQIELMYNQIHSNDDLRLIFELFMERSYLLPWLLNGKCKTLDNSETVEDYDLQTGIGNQQNEYMKMI